MVNRCLLGAKMKIFDLRLWLFVLFCLFANACTAPRTQNKGSANETIAPSASATAMIAAPTKENDHVIGKAAAMAKDRLGLESSEYWTNPKRTADEEVGRMLDEEFSGIVIGAPTKVPVDLQQTLPLVAIRAGSYKETWEVNFGRHALFAAMDLDMNVLYSNWVVDQEAEFPEQNPNDAPKGRTASVKVLDAREPLGLPWHEGRYLLTVIMREKASNRVDVELGRGAYKDEEVEKFLATERAKLAPPKVHPPETDTLPTYRVIAGSPKIPAEVGIEMSVERVVVLREHERWVLKGAFRLPALAHEIVRPPPNPPAEKPKGPIPTAIVGITLLATGSERPAPNTLRLAVPSYDRIYSTDKNPIVTGHFAINLMTRPEIPRMPQTVFLYAFSGRVLTGPLTTGLVPESRLPRRER